MKTKPFFAAAAMLALFTTDFVGAPAFAQDAAGPAEREAGPGITVSGSATVVSDYRFRGISRSDGDPAVQGQVYLDLPGCGFYVGVFGSSLGSGKAGDAEFDLIAGHQSELSSGVKLDAGAIYYAFVGDRKTPLAGGIDDLDGYVEPYAAVSYTLGPVQAKVGAAYAPDQSALRGDNLYLYGQAQAGIPATPVTLTVRLGRSKGALAPGSGSYFDWSIGADYVIGPVTLGAKYIDTNIDEIGIDRVDRRYDANVVLSTSIGF